MAVAPDPSERGGGALRRQLERDGLDDLIGELVEVNGPLDAAAVARYVDEWNWLRPW